MKSLVAYLKARLDERSTWLMIGAGVTAAAALRWPWDLVAAVVAIVGALVPSKGTGDAS